LLHPVTVSGKGRIGAVIDDETHSAGRGVLVEKGVEAWREKSSTGKVNIILREKGFL
jgi:hypothetical protein